MGESIRERLRRKRAERAAGPPAPEPRAESGPTPLHAEGFTHASRCLACSALLVWVTLDSGKRHPLNAEPFSVSRVAGEGRRVLAVIDGDTKFQTLFRGDGPHQARESHFATCPKAGGFRR